MIMEINIDNWKMQIRRGYLELCFLSLIRHHKQLYGFDLIDKLKTLGVTVKEGTLYPLLSRMSKDNILKTHWETEGNKGHPRKFYKLTEQGEETLALMEIEFKEMAEILTSIYKQPANIE